MHTYEDNIEIYQTLKRWWGRGEGERKWKYNEGGKLVQIHHKYVELSRVPLFNPPWC
jgi:hypothetical protein